MPWEASPKEAKLGWYSLPPCVILVGGQPSHLVLSNLFAGPGSKETTSEGHEQQAKLLESQALDLEGLYLGPESPNFCSRLIQSQPEELVQTPRVFRMAGITASIALPASRVCKIKTAPFPLPSPLSVDDQEIGRYRADVLPCWLSYRQGGIHVKPSESIRLPRFQRIWRRCLEPCSKKVEQLITRR